MKLIHGRGDSSQASSVEEGGVSGAESFLLGGKEVDEGAERFLLKRTETVANDGERKARTVVAVVERERKVGVGGVGADEEERKELLQVLLWLEEKKAGGGVDDEERKDGIAGCCCHRRRRSCWWFLC
ncbi:hypothetical protein IMY05_015G0115000 [Salix suchowensis]|nr:hypothetical protein IMY05_015G0115000 [Salix suchowensis]